MSTSNQEIQSALDIKPIIDNSVIDGTFSLQKCDDIHIGPKYENSNNVVINHNISVSSDELGYDIKCAMKEEIFKFRKDSEIHKDSAYQCSKFVNALIIIALVLVTILTMTMLSLYSGKERGVVDVHKNEVTPYPVLHSDEYPVDMKFVLRESWGASPPVLEQNENPLPVRRVIFIHTVSSRTCNRFTTCADIVRSIQDLHMDNNWGDIGYNFVIGGDSYIYVGVGWDKVGVHTAGYNTGSVAVAFIGDFRTDELNEKMILSAKKLLEFGVKRKKLGEDYQLFGHCQIHSGFPYSPGKNIMKIIKDWDHWNDTHITNCK